MSRLRRSSINMFSSVAGWLVPALANFAVTPILLSGLGEESYGLQGLVNVVIGYFVLMELGMDIPIIRFLAQKRINADSEGQSLLLCTTLQLYCFIGLIGLIIIGLGSEFLARNVFIVPESLIEDAVLVFKLTGVGFFGSVVTLWGRAATNGLQRYDISNAILAAVTLVGVGTGLIAVLMGAGVIGYVVCRVAAMLLAQQLFLLFFVHFCHNGRGSGV